MGEMGIGVGVGGEEGGGMGVRRGGEGLVGKGERGRRLGRKKRKNGGKEDGVGEERE